MPHAHAPDTLHIRPEQPGDEAAIDAALRAAFPTHLEADLVRALRAAGRLTASLVAAEAGQVFGHVAFSPVAAGSPLPLREGRGQGTPAESETLTLPSPGERGFGSGVGLAPLSVVPGRQRQGIGTRLVQAGLAACRAAGCRWVVVLGDPAYYGRFGFSPAARWHLTDEYGGGDAFQALELHPSALPCGPLLVHYATEFGMFAHLAPGSQPGERALN